MSIRLEPDGIYLLPSALDDNYYVILQAIETADGWHLVEMHGTPWGSDRFKERATLPADQMLRYRVDPNGTLLQQAPTAADSTRAFTLANLSLLGYLRGGNFVQPNEGL